MEASVNEGLIKKLNHYKTISWEKLGKNPLSNQILDESFIEKHVKSKQKAYNKMPITFNSSILKIGIQERMLKLYSNYFQDIKQSLSPLEGKVDRIILATKEQLLKPYEEINKGISEEKTSFKVLQTSQQVSDQEIKRLELKQALLKSISEQLILSESEKNTVLSPVSKDPEFNSANYELISVFRKILQIERIIKIIQENNPSQTIAESVYKDLKEMKNSAESKLLQIFKEIASSFESLNILNEIESYDVVKFTSQCFEILKNNEQYFSHCLSRVRDALRKAIYKDYLIIESEIQKYAIIKPDTSSLKMLELSKLFKWLIKSTLSVFDISKSVFF